MLCDYRTDLLLELIGLGKQREHRGVRRREKPLLFWGKTLAFSKKARIGGSGCLWLSELSSRNISEEGRDRIQTFRDRKTLKTVTSLNKESRLLHFPFA